MSDETHEFKVILEFDRPGIDFVCGFECGLVWTHLVHGDPGDEQTFLCHAANAEMLVRMADARHRQLVTKDVNDDWLEARFLAAARVN